MIAPAGSSLPTNKLSINHTFVFPTFLIIAIVGVCSKGYKNEDFLSFS